MNPNTYPAVHTVDAPASPPGPWRLIGQAVLFLLLAVVIQFAVAFALGFASGLFARRASGGFAVARGSAWLFQLAGLLTLHGALITIAWRRARKQAGGDVRVGLGLLPLRRVWLLSMLVPLAELAALLWVAALRTEFPTRLGLPPRLAGGFTGSPAIDLAVSALLIGVLPMISEEFFFRGWLWVALSRWWRPLPVGMATTALWLAAHAPDGWIRPLVLLPLGASLAFLRHRCGSLKASMVLHLVNNLAIVAVLFALRSR